MVLRDAVFESPKHPTATLRLQGLLAPLLHVADMAFPQQLKMSIFKLFGYMWCRARQWLHLRRILRFNLGSRGRRVEHNLC